MSALALDTRLEASCRQIVAGAVTSSFDQLAQRALTAAEFEAFGLEALEVFAARMDHPSTTLALKDTRQAADQMTQIHYLLLALSPFEREIRELLQRGRP